MRIFDKLFGKEKTSIIVIGILIFVSTALMSMIDCGKETETPMPTEFRIFSKYGFSFEYPKDFRVSEEGLWENEANDNSGIVQVEAQEEDKLFRVEWEKTFEPDLEFNLAVWLLRIERFEEIVSFTRSQFQVVETTKAGHKMLSQLVLATFSDGDRVCGVVGVFYCDKSQKMFTLSTASHTISANGAIIRKDFKNYLDSFVCH